MKILGKAGSIAKPSGTLTGPAGNIPISAVQVTSSVGSIPTARVSIPIEFLAKLPTEQNDDIYTVTVSDGVGTSATLFTGYVAGPRGRIGQGACSAGITLVHPARDMDQMRITAPSFHPASVFDYNYMFRLGNDTEGGGSGFNLQDGRFYTGGNLPQALVKGVIATLKDAAAGRLEGGGTQFKDIGLGPAIALLEKLKYRDGVIRGDLVGALLNEDKTGNSINAWAEARVMGSFNAMRSIWDTLTTLFSEFGIYLFGSCLGETWATVDVAGFTPPGENILGPDYITDIEWVSMFTRNISEVNLICDHIAGLDQEGGGAAGTLVTYPEKATKSGASIALQMPGWLSPLSSAQDYPQILKAQRAMAQAFFYIERNKLRTLSVSGPLAPLVTPGTTALIDPSSRIKALSGMKLDRNVDYTGYCYQIDHVMNRASNILQTNFSFRNVTEGKAETISQHPIFSDATPFRWA